MNKKDLLRGATILLILAFMLCSCVKKIENDTGVIPVPDEQQQEKEEDIKDKVAFCVSEGYRDILKAFFSGDGFVFLDDISDAGEKDVIVTEKKMSWDVPDSRRVYYIEDLEGLSESVNDICDYLRADLDRRNIYIHSFAAGTGMDSGCLELIRSYCSERNISFFTVNDASDMEKLLSDHPEGFAYIASDPEEAELMKEKMIDAGAQHLVSLFSMGWNSNIEEDIRKVMVSGALVLDRRALADSILESIGKKETVGRKALFIVGRDNIDSEDISDILGSIEE